MANAGAPLARGQSMCATSTVSSESRGTRTREGGFDLLFSDIGLPDAMNGVELAHEAERRVSGIKILLTTGYTGGTLPQHQAVGDFAMIPKPYYQADLARAVSSVPQGGMTVLRPTRSRGLA